MINREMRPVSVVSFTAGTDAYGQKRQNGSTTKEVQMVVKVYHQTNVDDIRYNDVTDIGITKATDITDENEIIIDNNRYSVLYVIPSSRYYQILMKKVGPYTPPTPATPINNQENEEEGADNGD